MGAVHIASGLSVKSASGNSVNLTLPVDKDLSAYLRVSASATPTTLDVVIEEQYDGTTWVTLASFTQIGAVSSGFEKIAIPKPRTGYPVRAKWTIVGTSYTFEVRIAE